MSSPVKMWFLEEVEKGPIRSQNLQATSPKITCTAIHSAQQDMKTREEKLYILGADSDYRLQRLFDWMFSILSKGQCKVCSSMFNTGIFLVQLDTTWIQLRSKKWGLGCGHWNGSGK